MQSNFPYFASISTDVFPMQSSSSYWLLAQAVKRTQNCSHLLHTTTRLHKFPNLTIQSSKTIDFSRLHACFSFKPYLFALVFALTSRNKGNFLFPADHLIQQPCGSTLRFPCSVSVDIHCGTDISVSEKLLHILWCCSI